MSSLQTPSFATILIPSRIMAPASEPIGALDLALVVVDEQARRHEVVELLLALVELERGADRVRRAAAELALVVHRRALPPQVDLRRQLGQHGLRRGVEIVPRVGKVRLPAEALDAALRQLGRACVHARVPPFALSGSAVDDCDFERVLCDRGILLPRPRLRQPHSRTSGRTRGDREDFRRERPHRFGRRGLGVVEDGVHLDRVGARLDRCLPAVAGLREPGQGQAPRLADAKRQLGGQVGHDLELGGGKERRAGYRPRSPSQASAASATSRQPLSIVSEWPRSGNSRKSVTAGECRYCLTVARLTASGTVWSLPPAVTSSGPRDALRVSTFAGELREKFAEAASNSGLPGRRDRPALVQLVRLLLRRGVAEAVAELLLGQRDRALAVRRVPQRDRRDAQRRRRQEDTPLIGAGSIATAAAARSWPSSRWAISPPNEWPITIGFASSALIDARVVVDDVVDAVARRRPRGCGASPRP